MEDRVKTRSLALLTLTASLALMSACSKPNPHDNARPPDPSTDKAVQNHRFDGGESDPYFKPGEQGGGEGGNAGAGGGE